MCRNEDYDANLSELQTYNESLAKWVEENSPKHWAMSKFTKKRWDKMITNLVESFNAWLKNERHHSIYTFMMEHIIKLDGMLVKHKEESKHWKGSIGPKIEQKLMTNITKGEGYAMSLFMNSRYSVSIGRVFVIVDLINRTCTCKAWQMSGIPCDHFCVVMQSIGQNVVEFVNEWFTFSKQNLIYNYEFCGIESHNLPTIGDDGLVRTLTGDIVFSLKPSCTKRPPGRPRKNA